MKTLLIYKGYELPRDIGLITGALCALIYFEIMLRSKPLPEILADIRNTGGAASETITRADISVKLDKLWRACDFWLSRLWRNQRPCLRRGLVLYRWCRKNGVESKLAVGAAKDGDALKGHAWLYVQGEVYREDAARLAAEYTVMLEG